jgi:hypothetical protein
MACTLFLGAAGLSGTASAADPVKVTITGSGPDRAYPLGQEFRVEGKPKRVPAQVELVFVRTAHKVFGLGDFTEQRCDKVQDAILIEGRLRDWSTPTPLGRTTVGALWSRVEDPIKSLAAFRASPWKRESDKDDTFVLSVPADDFFRAGATYCAFLLNTDTQPLVTKDMLAAVTKFVKGWQECTASSKPDACVPISKEYKESRKKAVGAANLLPEDEAAVEKQLRELADDMNDVSAQYRALAEAAKKWETIHRPQPQPAPKPGTSSEPSEASKQLNYLELSHPLGKLILALLVAHGDLVAGPAPPPPKDTAVARTGSTTGAQTTKAGGQTGTKVGEQPGARKSEEEAEALAYYYAPTLRKPVTHVAIAGDLTEIRITTDRSDPTALRRLETTPDKLPLPGVELSLRDVLELSRGNVKIGGKYQTFNDGFEAVLRPILSKDGLSIDGAKLGETLRPFLAYLTQVDLALAKAWETHPPSPGADISVERRIPLLLRWRPVYEPLRAWLATVVLNDCSAIDAAVKTLGLEQPEDVCAKAKSPAWPGFPGTNNPFLAARNTLQRIATKSESAQKIKAALEIRQQRASTAVSSAVTVANRIDRQTWFAQYVVTTVGIASVPEANDPFFVNYYGFKVYPFANRVDEPKWMFNSGWHRLVSLELALVPNLSTFGPSKRFQGLAKGDVPPLMAGVSFQPIPYITLSTGLIFMESRRSVLPQETASVFISPYLAIAADVNILDIAARALTDGQTNAIKNLAEP